MKSFPLAHRYLPATLLALATGLVAFASSSCGSKATGFTNPDGGNGTDTDGGLLGGSCGGGKVCVGSEIHECNADGTPGWLTSMHHLAGTVLSHAGSAPFIALVVLMVVIGVAGLGVRPWRTVAAVAGAVVATTFWVLGQNIGQLYSGQATDPNTGPLIVLMALALVGSTASTRPFTTES